MSQLDFDTPSRTREASPRPRASTPYPWLAETSSRLVAMVGAGLVLSLVMGLGVRWYVHESIRSGVEAVNNKGSK